LGRFELLPYSKLHRFKPYLLHTNELYVISIFVTLQKLYGWDAFLDLSKA